MGKGFDWRRAKPKRPTLCIKDKKEPEPSRRPYVKRRGPKLTKEQWRQAGADAVKEFEAKKAANPAPEYVKPPWEE